MLAFDTSTQACTAALLVQGDAGEPVVYAAHRLAPMQHTQLILPMIETLMSEAGLALNQLTVIAVGVGPGSFTGCRLGVSVAQGLGFAHHLPLVPVSSMEALALTVFMEYGYRQVLVALDAKSGDIYWAGYHITAEGEVDCVIPEQLSPANAVVWPENEQWVGVGDGWKVSEGPDMLLPDVCPRGVAIAKLGLALYEQGKCCPPAQLEPRYLR